MSEQPQTRCQTRASCGPTCVGLKPLTPCGVAHRITDRALTAQLPYCSTIMHTCLEREQGSRMCCRAFGLMDKALVLGTKDCRFESCQGLFTCSTHVSIPHFCWAKSEAIQYGCNTYTVHSRMLSEPTALPCQEAQTSSQACLGSCAFYAQKEGRYLYGAPSRPTCVPRTKLGRSLAGLFSEVAARRRHHVHSRESNSGHIDGNDVFHH